MNWQTQIYYWLLCTLLHIQSSAQTGSLVIRETGLSNSFPLVSGQTTASFCYDTADATVVGIAAEAFRGDIKLVTGKELPIMYQADSENTMIIAGTIGQSKFIDELIKKRELNVTAIQNGWERFIITVLRSGGKTMLVIAGSDRRGTAFGIFHLSRLMGVSPFVWWADVVPAKKRQLFVSGSYTSASPSVQYRGIFINDEDWGLQPWAAKHMDTVIKDIGPETYARVFELLLRLKANYIWPAMHPCTKAFYYYKDNPKVADDYAIVVGGSHCEPMLRNNVFEWVENYQHEYGTKPGEWRYDLNKNQIFKYWDDRVKEAVNFESVYTVGMRGVHDGSMPGPKDPDEKLKLLENVVADQRTILTTNLKKSAVVIPQIFVPYKEVLSLYRRGMKLEDDITIIWPDDNHGYIRQLPNAGERKRNGGHGVYYHLSYWGAPQDYLWLSTISPSLIAYELEKAYHYNAQKLWVFNAGDIKPAELEIQFALDMAWDIRKWNTANAASYTKAWAEETFGKTYATEIAAVKNEYYVLAASGKPEHLSAVQFTMDEANERLKRYKIISEKAEQLLFKLPEALHDAYYQLILYPVQGAALMNEKILYAKLSIVQNDPLLAEKSRNAFEAIQTITDIYNNQISKGKWNSMMNSHPRDQAVFKMPVTVATTAEEKKDSLEQVYFTLAKPVLTIPAVKYKHKKESAAFRIGIINGIGVNGKGLAAASKKNIVDTMPLTEIVYAEYELPLLEKGAYEVVVKCLPLFDVNKSKHLNYGISVGDEKMQVVNVHAEADSKAWRGNVLRGYSSGKTGHVLNGNKLRIYFKDANLVIGSIELFKTNK